MTQVLRIGRCATALALVGLLTVVAGAGAVAIEGGKTRLKLDPALLERLEQSSVRVKALKPGTLRGGRIVALPVTEGLLETRLGTGYLFLGGGIRFTSPRGSVALRKPIQNTAKQTLRGALGGYEVKIASPEGVKVDETGFDIDLGVESLKLTGRAASILNKGLGVAGVFRAGQSLGSTASVVQPPTVETDGGSFEFVLDAGFSQKLQSLGVSVAPYEATTPLGTTPPAFRFSAFSGAVNRHLTHGEIGSGSHGGLRLAQGGPEAREITWPGFGLGFENGYGGPSSDIVTTTWKVPAGFSAFGPIGQIDFGTKPAYDARKGIVSAGPTLATLAPYAVAPLNEIFAGGKPVFAVDEPLGTFSFSVRLRSR